MIVHLFQFGMKTLCFVNPCVATKRNVSNIETGVSGFLFMKANASLPQKSHTMVVDAKLKVKNGSVLIGTSANGRKDAALIILKAFLTIILHNHRL